MRNRINVSLFLIIIIFIFQSCSSSDLSDCIASHKANIENNSVPDGQLNTYYETEIKGEVLNTIHDNSFDYEFSWDGALPNGLQFQQSGRNYVLSGTPMGHGTYTITVFLTVESNDDDNRFCLGSQSTEKTFSLKILP